MIMDHSQDCDRTRLLRLMEEKTGGDEQQRLIEHLDTCTHCQNELETIAADDWWWTRGAQLLRHDDTMEVREWLDEEPAAVNSLNADADNRESFSEDSSPSELGGETYGFHELFGATERPGWLGRVDKYEVERLIGRGGMGVVFKGYDAELDRWVAMKMLAPHLAVSGTARQRFIREARAAAAVVHEHVVAIHGIESHENIPYIVMPLVSGDSLQRYVDQKGPLPVRDIVRIAYQIAAGLSAAHRQGLVHRDIKPGNILLDNGFNRVQITDFGLARAADDASLTRTGFVAGTPHYMSPEQAHGEVIDPRSDLFSLGSVIYFMATGRPPFLAENPIAVLHKICHEQPVPVQQSNEEIPAELQVLVSRLMDRDLDNRIQDANQLQRILVEYLNHLQDPVRKPVPKLLVPQKKRRKYHWWHLLLIAPVLGSGVLAAGVFFLLPWLYYSLPSLSIESHRRNLMAYQDEKPYLDDGLVSDLQPPGVSPMMADVPQIVTEMAAPARSLPSMDDEQVQVELNTIELDMAVLESSENQQPLPTGTLRDSWNYDIESVQRTIEALEQASDF
ncbi:MAG: serine/threonine protein kinase [Pirellulaceae bacterium]|jgi:serine/threonine protein kinase